MLSAVVAVLAMSGLVTGTVWSLVGDGERRALTAAAMQADGVAGSDSPDLVSMVVTATDDAPTPGLSAPLMPAIDRMRGDVPVTVSMWAQSPLLPMDTATPAAAYLLDIDDLDTRTRLIDGRAPRTTPGTTEVVIAPPTALALGLDVGDEVPLAATGSDISNGEPPAVTATVVGIVDLVGTGWDRDLLDGRGVATDRGWVDTYGPFLTAPGVVLSRTDAAAPARISVLVDPDFSTGVDLPHFAARVDTLSTDVARELDDRGRAVVRSDIATFAHDAARDVAVTRSVVLAASAMTIALAVIALALAGTLLVTRRHTETTLWRARGASAAQLAGRAAREAAVLAAVAVALAIPAATLTYGALVRTPVLARAWPFIDATAPFSADAALAVAVGVVVPALAVVIAAAVTPAAQTRRELNGVSRAGIDIAALVLAVGAAWQLSQRGFGEGSDIAALLAPVLGVLAGAAVVLRVIGPLAAFAERFAHRSRAVTGALAGWGLARAGATRGAYLYAAGAATIVVTLTTVGTWTASAAEQADLDMGADAVVAVPLTPGSGAMLAERSACGPLTAVADRPVLLGSRPAGTRILALDTTASDVVRGAPNADMSWSQALAPLHPSEPVGGWPVTGADIDLTVTGDMEVDGAQMVASVAAIVDAGGGDRFASSHVSVPLDGVTRDVRVTVPDGEPGWWAVVGFAVTVRADEVAPDRATSNVTRAGTLSIDLAEATTDEPAPPPPAWTATVPDTHSTLRTHVNATSPTGLAIDLTGNDAELVWTSASLVVTAWEAPAEVPVLVAEDLATDLGVMSGDALDVRLDGAPLTVRVAGTVRAVPSRPHADAILADIDTLSRALLVQGNTERLTDAWWLSLDCPNAEPEALAALPGITFLTDARADAQAGPVRAAAWVALWIAGVAAAAFVIAGAAVRAATRAHTQTLAVARLRGVGVPARSVAVAEAAQQAVVVTLAMVCGATAGAAVAWVLAPLIVVAPGGLPAVPAARWVAGGPWPWWLVGTAVVAVLVAIPSVRALVRRSPASALRKGEA